MGVADWGIGHVVSGVTATGEKFAGEVFTFDEGTGLAVLRAKGDIVNTHDVRILRVEGVSDLKSTPPSDPPKMEKLPVVDEARCQKREEAAVKAATISAGVPSIRPSSQPSSLAARASSRLHHAAAPVSCSPSSSPAPFMIPCTNASTPSCPSSTSPAACAAPSRAMATGMTVVIMKVVVQNLPGCSPRVRGRG